MKYKKYSITKPLILWFRAITGLHNVYNGTTCEISNELFDVHDYYIHRGGDGFPSHFYTYKCWNCGKEFII